MGMVLVLDQVITKWNYINADTRRLNCVFQAEIDFSLVSKDDLWQFSQTHTHPAHICMP